LSACFKIVALKFLVSINARACYAHHCMNVAHLGRNCGHIVADDIRYGLFVIYICDIHIHIYVMTIFQLEFYYHIFTALIEVSSSGQLWDTCLCNARSYLMH
jgi:hypothetical protein